MSNPDTNKNKGDLPNENRRYTVRSLAFTFS
jgi:hypothetical protein